MSQPILAARNTIIQVKKLSSKTMPWFKNPLLMQLKKIPLICQYLLCRNQNSQLPILISKKKSDQPTKNKLYSCYSLIVNGDTLLAAFPEECWNMKWNGKME